MQEIIMGSDYQDNLMLVCYARNNYGIRLSRQSNVSLSVTISGIKNSIVDSVLLWCKEYKITDTKKYRENAEAEFEKLYTEAKSMYAEDDVVSIVQYIQNGMVGCFKGICEELDCLAAQQQLKDFIAKYQINVKENLDKNYYWDKLFSKYGKGGKEISVEDFNSIFTMTYEELMKKLIHKVAVVLISQQLKKQKNLEMTWLLDIH